MANYKNTLDSDIKNLLTKRKSDELLVYITGDKRPIENFGTQVHPEIIPLFYKHLKLIGKKNKISLLLYTSGGALEAPWPLVNLIREYCKEFEVLIPFKALSAGTLISLGADIIATTPMSALSPVDPAGNFMIANQQRSIQVEDVIGFIEFSKSKVGLESQEGLSDILKALVSDTPPQILGNIHRTHSLIRLLVDKMLSLHRKTIPDIEAKKIKESLTEKLYSHQHYINRRELVSLGFKNIVEELTDEQEKNLLNIFNYFSDKMELEETFDPAKKLGSNQIIKFNLTRAIISSSKFTHIYSSEYTVENKPINPEQSTIFMNIKDSGWIEGEI